MLEFQEHVLKQQLDRLPPRSRVAFAACCAQRMMDVCHRFLACSRQNDRTGTCDAALDHVWTHILDASEMTVTERLLTKIIALIPDQDAPGWTPLTAYAEDGLSALAYCLRCVRSADSQDATWAARRVYEALDCLVTNSDNSSPDGPTDEARVVSEPLIQAELERQVRDLADLSAAGDSLSQQLLDRLRKRSAQEQAIAPEQFN